MKKFFILVLGMIMLMLIPINVKADDEVEIGVDQEESNIECYSGGIYVIL